MSDYTATHAGAGMLTATSLNHATAKLCRELIERGVTNERRGGRITEFLGPQLVEITEPHKNLLCLRGRKSNPWVQLAEFPWLMAGRNDVGWLQRYLPRAGDFSDDGIVWRAGYGPRLTGWDGWFNQLVHVADVLVRDPGSRRAVISLWDPEQDSIDNSRDYPCTNWLHFQMVDGKLDLTVVMRSNDLIWGFSGVNVTNFTLIQCVVACSLGVEMGVYRHLSNNLHSYDRHYGMLRDIVAHDPECFYDWPFFDDNPLKFRALDIADICVACEDAVWSVERNRSYPFDPDIAMEVARMESANVAGSWLGDWIYFMLLHDLSINPTSLERTMQCVANIRHKDLRWVAADYLFPRAQVPADFAVEDIRRAYEQVGLATVFDRSMARRAESSQPFQGAATDPSPNPPLAGQV